MTRFQFLSQSSRTLAILLLAFLTTPLAAQLSPAATAGFNAYAASVEARLAQQHRTPGAFLAQTQTAPVANHPVIEQLTPNPSPVASGAMLHHWRGTAFAPGAHAADFDRILRDFPSYPRYFAPQVLKAALLTQSGDRLRASMRLRQHHVLTVVLDTDYAVDFGALDVRHRFSLSRSTRVAEIASPGTPGEHALRPADEHGFLYRLNTYWSYEERPEGLYLQIESISLTRAIPPGLGWAIRPFVESIPRESLEFTLQAATQTLHP